MQIGEWIGLAGLLATNAATAVGIYKYFNNKVDRVYQRFDELKKAINVEFVSKDICKIMLQLLFDSGDCNWTGPQLCKRTFGR